MSGGNKQTQQQTQNSETSPWAAAQPLLQKLIGQYGGMDTSVTGAQTSALDKLNQEAGGIADNGANAQSALDKAYGSDTTPQMGMLSDALKQIQGNLGGTASGAELNPLSTPGFSDALNTMTQNITNATKGVYAGSGRDPSGAGSFAGSLARGLTQGEAPVIASQFNQNKANQMGAANTLFGAGDTAATGEASLGQIPIANALAAIGATPAAATAATVPGSAALGAASAQYSQPWTNLQALLGPALGLGGMGNQSSGTSTGTTTQSQSALSNIMGGIMGGAGLLGQTGAFGPAGWLLASDKDVKEEIEPIGKLNDGQVVHRFRYKGDPTMRMGLLAQDVEKFEPDAVHDVGGMLAVDHRKATQRAAEMGRAA